MNTQLESNLAYLQNKLPNYSSEQIKELYKVIKPYLQGTLQDLSYLKLATEILNKDLSQLKPTLKATRAEIIGIIEQIHPKHQLLRVQVSRQTLKAKIYVYSEETDKWLPDLDYEIEHKSTIQRKGSTIHSYIINLSKDLHPKHKSAEWLQKEIDNALYHRIYYKGDSLVQTFNNLYLYKGRKYKSLQTIIDNY